MIIRQYYVTAIVVFSFFLSMCKRQDTFNTEKNSTKVSGTVVYLTPVSKAQIKVYRLTDTGEVNLVGEGESDEKGKFNIITKNLFGTMLVESVGQSNTSYVEPLSLLEIQPYVQDKIKYIEANVNLGSSHEIVISPWSSFITARAQWEQKNLNKSWVDSVSHANDLFKKPQFWIRCKIITT